MARTQTARAAAEGALVRIAHHYGGIPEFVVIGGLVPPLLCAAAAVVHAGTTDVDVQVDLEIANGAVGAARLERALRNAEFEPVSPLEWRWRALPDGPRAEVRFELLADLADHPAEAIISFDECERLGALNLPGTGFAARDAEARTMSAKIGGVLMQVEINVTGLAGFLLAKTAAARARRKPKDWYDIAFVLIHNDAGGVDSAVDRVRDAFSARDLRYLQTALRDLKANFADPQGQGPRSYAEQMLIDDRSLSAPETSADSVLAVTRFCDALLPTS